MTADAFVRIASEGLVLALILSGIPVLAAMVVGLLVSIFQAATQIQEQTLTVVPKIVVVFLTIVVAGTWMIRELMEFTAAVFGLIF